LGIILLSRAAASLPSKRIDPYLRQRIKIQFQERSQSECAVDFPPGLFTLASNMLDPLFRQLSPTEWEAERGDIDCRIRQRRLVVSRQGLAGRVNS